MFTLCQFSRTWVDSSKIYAIRRQILMLKCTKFDFRWGSTPDPLAGFKAPTSKGREAKMEGRGRMDHGEWRKKMRALRKKEVDRREGKEEEGICRTNVKVLPTPLHRCLPALRWQLRRRRNTMSWPPTELLVYRVEPNKVITSRTMDDFTFWLDLSLADLT